MADDDPIVLYQHPPGWGLASRDAACLAVQTALKLARLPFTVNNAGNTAVSPTGELPLLCAGEELFSGFGPCLAYIRNRDTSDVFNALTDEEGASAKAFMSLVQVELQYAKIYWYWFEEDNYTAVTHPRFASRFAWPLNIFLAWRQRRDYHALLSTKFEQVSAEKIYAAASTALDALSARLGDSDWFFASPSALDCCVAAYVSEILGAGSELPTPALATIVRGHPTLVAHAQRVLAQLE